MCPRLACVTCPEEGITEEEREDHSEGGDHVGRQEDAHFTQDWGSGSATEK